MTSTSKEFCRQIYLEDDDGAAIIKPHKVKLGGKTDVDLDPETKAATSAETASDVVRDKNSSDKIDFPQQRGPTNPIDRIRQMYNDSLAQQTRRAQQRQWGRYRDQ